MDEDLRLEEQEDVAFVCTHVFDNLRPILYVTHENGGEWQFLCGAAGHGANDARVVGANHLWERDQSLSSLKNLPAGWEAERVNVAKPWTRRKM